MQVRAVLRLGEPAAMGALAEHLGCDPSYVTEIADRLERMGLLERMPGAAAAADPSRAEAADGPGGVGARGSAVTAGLDAAERQRRRELFNTLPT